ncbi:maestro heat-like repeat-containing protein family member 1 [Diorhabda sublineata]|uniref:maestro heat-like repeat-containing protein family member 1 n=1 Tax=Diorhabda sublineata TaxID=1163346 RepID=UPI0024E1171B|nr:maestro heat-like repeat-containing protein family member 1 [Diorhabda sublineata]
MAVNVKINAETQLQVTIGRLLQSVTDKSFLVSESVKCSLKKLSDKHPNQVLNSCCQFINKNPKPLPEHISSILHIMEIVCSDHLVKINGDTIILTVDVSLSVMTENISYEPIIQTPASGVLVALGREHYVQIIDSLQAKMQPGVIPHHMIPYTMGALASVNALAIVPYLKDIFNIMLPLLGGIKTDILKQAFSFALGNFCEALTEYISNCEKVPDTTIDIENFGTEISTVYDVLFSTWIYSRDSKTTESVLEALTSIFPIMSIERVTQQTTKTIQILINLYKKHVNPYNITKCLGSVIQKAVKVNGMLLEPLLQNILSNLFDLVCVSPDYAQPGFLKSHSEVLRCYESFALHFTDNTIDQLLSQLKNNNDKEKVKSLIVITHLVSHSGDQSIKRRYKDIVRYINELLNDNNVKIKTSLVKLIVALSCKNVIVDKDINPDGPGKYMEFILKLSCKQILPKNHNIDTKELENIQKSSDNTLYMLTTSVPDLESFLWDLLLNSFLNPVFDDAIIIILRCLTHLASKRDSIQCCDTAFVRCLSLLANPVPDFRGCFVLNFLKNIKPCNVETYKSVWDTKIPQLLKYLEQNFENFHVSEWHDLVFDFLNILFETTDNTLFTEIVVTNTKKQLDVYNNTRYIANQNGVYQMKQSEKHFLLKCLAITLCYIKDKETVTQSLDNILNNVKLTDYTECHTCAEAVGICSRSHLQLVLDKLAAIRRDVLTKKSSKFMIFLKDQKHEVALDRLRYAVLCSYAQVCNEAPADKLLRVVESEILDYAVNELNNSRDFFLKKICLKTIHAVADAMHPNRNSLHIRMNERDNVIRLVSSQVQLHNGPEYIELFPLIIPTVTALIRLPLPIESAERIDLLKLFFDNVYNAAIIYCKINQDNVDKYYGDLKLAPHVTKSFTELNQLVKDLLLQNLSPAALDEIVTLLEPWLGKKRPEQRLPAAETLRLVLQSYLDNMKFAYECPTTFGQTGFLLAKVVPRCADPNKNIRKVAVDCLCLILCIAARYEGHMRDHDKVLSNSLQHIQQKIDSDEPKQLYNLTCDLAHVICANLPAFQLIHCVDGLSDALLDCEASSSNGSGVVLNLILKTKGGELLSNVVPVLEKLLRQLHEIRCPRTKSSTYRAVFNLAMHHSKTVCGVLLNQPLPYDSSICECWSIISTDPTLAADLMDQLKKSIKSTPLYEDQGGGDMKVANLQPLQAVCAFHEILKNPQLKEICLQQFPDLFTLFLICVSSYMNTVAPFCKKNDVSNEKFTFTFNRQAYKLVPSKVAVETFRSFLLCCEFEKMASGLLIMNNSEALENVEVFLQVIQLLVENVCLETSQSLSWLVASLGPYIRADLDPQRIATVAFFSHLLQQSYTEQNVLTENLLEMILDVQGDTNCLVRKLGLRGLGYAAEHLSYELVSRHCNPILGVLMNSLDYNNIGVESAVILEGMLSFSKLLTTMEGCKFSSFQVTAAVRIKPLLDQEDVNLRRAAFRLLGDLTQSINSEGNLEAFREQIHGNVVTLLLHLSDPDIYVVKACKYTLRKIGPYLEGSKVNSMIQEHLIDEANLHFNDFVRDFIKLMAADMQDLFPLLIMTCLSYFKSQWVEIKGNAALITGVLYSQMIPENRSRVSLDTVCDRLLRLINDENEDVRIKAVEAVSYLFID